MSAIVARVVVVGSLFAASWVAYHAGGGGEALPRPPTPMAAEPPAKGARGKDDTGYEVALRLVEQMNDARVETTNAPLRAPLLAEWRKTPIMWAPLVGDAVKNTTTIALRTAESEHVQALPGADGWDADARVWNANEATFDQRDAIVSPTPMTVTFHVTVPALARLDFATAVLGGRGETEFGVTIVDAAGHTKELFSRSMPSKDGKRWSDAAVDLGPYGGQAIELRLRATPKLMVAMVSGMSQIETSTSAVALWGNPEILTRRPTTVPYNVLFLAVDALRADAIAGLHDDDEDAAERRAKIPPLDARLPKMPGLTPSIDALAARGVRFTHAYANGTWTRPATLALLGGARSSELGIDPFAFVIPQDQASSFYASSPPLLPLLARRAGMETRAFVGDDFLLGYSPIGVDAGFDAVEANHFRTRDTLEITAQATSWMKAHAKERFFLYCALRSPHEPLEAPERFKARVPAAPLGPADGSTRAYLAEVAKDDEAVGVLVRALDELGLRDRTLVVLVAGHGETLAAAHDGKGADKIPMRYHAAAGNFEEATHIPILLSLPGVLADGRDVRARVRAIDVAPTVLEVLGLERALGMVGASLLPLARGEAEADARVVLTEGRGSRALLYGQNRLVVHDAPAPPATSAKGDKPGAETEELFDLVDDPGERHNLARERPDVLLEMRARMDAARKNVPVAGTHAASRPDPVPATAAVHLRFAGGGLARRIAGTIRPAEAGARIVGAAAANAGAESLKVAPDRVEVAMESAPDGVVGVDLRVEPAGAALSWEIFVDEVPLRAANVFGGPFGFAASSLVGGIVTEDARAAAFSPLVAAAIDPHRDAGLFVTCDHAPEPARDDGLARNVRRDDTREAADEATRALREGGYLAAGAPPIVPSPGSAAAPAAGAKSGAKKR